MTSLVRKATLLSVCGLLVASAAMAGVPNKNNSVMSSPCLVLVGDNGVEAAPAVTDVPFTVRPDLWTITVKDGAVVPNPVPFATVVINMSLCPDIHVATQKSQLGNASLGVPAGIPQVNGSMHVDPLLLEVWTVADASGIARFVVEGGASPNLYTGSTYAAGCAQVTADSQDMGKITISALNRNVTAPALGAGSNPVNATDGSVLLQMLVPFPQPYKAHADLDCSGTSDGVDASIILQHVVTPAFPGKSNICPPDGVPADKVNSPGYAW